MSWKQDSCRERKSQQETGVTGEERRPQKLTVKVASIQSGGDGDQGAADAENRESANCVCVWCDKNGNIY